jgi:MFS family permease
VLGPIFSSALTGLMVGYLLLSALSDRFGNRRLIIISTVTLARSFFLEAIVVSLGVISQAHGYARRGRFRQNPAEDRD